MSDVRIGLVIRSVRVLLLRMPNSQVRRTSLSAIGCRQLGSTRENPGGSADELTLLVLLALLKLMEQMERMRSMMRLVVQRFALEKKEKE